MERLTNVIGTCNGENIYGTAEAKIRIRNELEKSGEVKNPEALDYFANIRFENKLVTKLGKYEDIDEELGIEFAILSKILKKKKVWLIHEDVLRKERKIVESEFVLELFADMNGNLVCYLWFKDYATQIPAKFYGKHYALTKEELEKQL